MSVLQPALHDSLRALKLSGMLQTLDARLAQAAAGELGHLDFLQVLCDDEITRRQASPAGRAALAIAWVRNFNTHHLVEVSKVGNLYSGYYTKLYGVLVWRNRSDITAVQDNEGRRHEFYDTELAGNPVLDTLQNAVSAVIAVIPG
jgi:hypothetical protein